MGEVCVWVYLVILGLAFVAGLLYVGLHAFVFIGAIVQMVKKEKKI